MVVQVELQPRVHVRAASRQLLAQERERPQAAVPVDSVDLLEVVVVVGVERHRALSGAAARASEDASQSVPNVKSSNSRMHRRLAV